MSCFLTRSFRFICETLGWYRSRNFLNLISRRSCHRERGLMRDACSIQGSLSEVCSHLRLANSVTGLTYHVSILRGCLTPYQSLSRELTSRTSVRLYRLNPKPCKPESYTAPKPKPDIPNFLEGLSSKTFFNPSRILKPNTPKRSNLHHKGPTNI